MLSELQSGHVIVGIKQLQRALAEGRVAAVFLAEDADPLRTEPLAEVCRSAEIPMTWVPTMVQLGRACGIAVGAAAAGLLRE